MGYALFATTPKDIPVYLNSVSKSFGKIDIIPLPKIVLHFF